jgi:hypothetical protein
MRAVIISLAFVVSASVHAQTPIAVELESHHKPVFADQSLRILDVVVPEGETTLDHTHQYDIATVCIECAVTRNRVLGETWGEIRKREVGGITFAEYSGKPAAHAIRNVGEGFFHLIAVENLRPAEWPTAKRLDGQPATAQPGDTGISRLRRPARPR